MKDQLTISLDIYSIFLFLERLKVLFYKRMNAYPLIFYAEDGHTFSDNEILTLMFVKICKVVRRFH